MLKKILRKIDHQKGQWENEGKEDDLDTSTHRVPEDTHHTLPPASPKPREPSTPPAPTAPPVPSTPPVPTASQLPTTPLVHHSPMRHQLQNAHLMVRINCNLHKQILLHQIEVHRLIIESIHTYVTIYYNIL